jgi:predicted Zn finger-like uncharacterized protein
MPELIRCPSCDAALRVPESLLGQTVKCPKCATTFTAELPPPQSVHRDLPPPEESSPFRIREDEADDFGAAEEDRPRRRRRRGRHDDYTDAEAELAGPAIALMVSAGLGIAANIACILFQLFSVGTNAPGPRKSEPGYVLGYSLGMAMVSCGPFLPGIIICFIMWAGAIKMKRLQSFGLAMTACILAMIPCNCCFILGIPFGIWGLVILNKPAVKEAFS